MSEPTHMDTFRQLFASTGTKELCAEFQNFVVAATNRPAEGARQPLNLVEFKMAVWSTKPAARNTLTDEELTKIFMYIDANGSGKMSMFEFVKSVQKSGEGTNMEDTEALMTRFRSIFPSLTRKDLTEVFKKMAQQFSNKDDSQRRPLKQTEFKRALVVVMPEEVKEFSESDLTRIFEAIDENNTGKVSLLEFVKGVRGNLPDYRQALVKFVFDRLDANRNGFIEESELGSFFKKSAHPDILMGKIKPAQKSAEILTYFGCMKERKIPFAQFVDLYLTKSLVCSNDYKFRDEILQFWLLSEQEAKAYVSQHFPEAKPIRNRNKKIAVEPPEPSNPSNRNAPASPAGPMRRRDRDVDKMSSTISLEGVMDRLRDYFARTFDAEFHSELPEKPLTQLVSRVMDNDPNDVVFRPMPISKMQAKLDDMLPMIKQEFSSDEVSMILKMLDTQSTGNVSFADIVNAIRTDVDAGPASSGNAQEVTTETIVHSAPTAVEESSYRTAPSSSSRMVSSTKDSLNTNGDRDRDGGRDPTFTLMSFLKRFRNLFKDLSQRELSAEFKALAKVVAERHGLKEDQRRPINCRDMHFALCQLKGSDFERRFSENDFEKIFNHMDQFSSGKVSLFEFVKGIQSDPVAAPAASAPPADTRDTEFQQTNRRRKSISKAPSGGVATGSSAGGGVDPVKDLTQAYNEMMESQKGVESIEDLVKRFRKTYEEMTRKDFQDDYKKMCVAMCVSGDSLSAIQFVAATRKMKQAQTKDFSEMDLKRVFECMDADGSGKVSSSEFVKFMRGTLSPYRQAIVDFVFRRVDINNRGYLGEAELLYYFRNFPNPKERTFAVFRTFSCHNSNRRIPYAWAVEHYLTQSLRTDDDDKFRSDIFQFWSITDVVEAEEFIYKHIASNPQKVEPLEDRYMQRRQAKMEAKMEEAAAAVNARTTSSNAIKDVPAAPEEPIEALMFRFRKIFSGFSRKDLTSEYQRMSSLIMEDSRAKKRKPLGMNEMKSALTRAKPDFADKFTADDFIRIFNFIDDNGSGKISLFEFVEGIRGILPPARQALVDYVFTNIDRNRSGSISEGELLRFFEKSQHPEIKSALVQPKFKCQNVMQAITGNAKDKKFSYAQCVDYHLTMSLSFDNDKDFEKELFDFWLISGANTITEAANYVANYMAQLSLTIANDPDANKVLRRKSSVASSIVSDLNADDIEKVALKQMPSIKESGYAGGEYSPTGSYTNDFEPEVDLMISPQPVTAQSQPQQQPSTPAAPPSAPVMPPPSSKRPNFRSQEHGDRDHQEGAAFSTSAPSTPVKPHTHFREEPVATPRSRSEPNYVDSESRRDTGSRSYSMAPSSSSHHHHRVESRSPAPTGGSDGSGMTDMFMGMFGVSSGAAASDSSVREMLGTLMMTVLEQKKEIAFQKQEIARLQQALDDTVNGSAPNSRQGSGRFNR